MSDRRKLRQKKCANGCDAPVCPPSKVICRACIDKITANLEEMERDIIRRTGKEKKG